MKHVFARLVALVFVLFALGATSVSAQTFSVIKNSASSNMAPQRAVNNHLVKGAKASATVTKTIAAPTATTTRPMTGMAVVPKGVKNITVVIGTIEVQLLGCSAPDTIYAGTDAYFVCSWNVRNNTNADADLDVYSGVFGVKGEKPVEFNTGKELLVLPPGAQRMFTKSILLPSVPSFLVLSFSVNMRDKPMDDPIVDYQWAEITF